MQETEHIMGCIHYSPKEAPFIFFPSSFSKAEGNGIVKALRLNDRTSSPKSKKKKGSLCAWLLKVLNRICDTREKQVTLSSLQALNLAA